MNLIVSLMVMAGLLFGGGATVAAAQDELPNQPLYQLKLMSEEANMWFAFTPDARIEKLMEQAQTRLQEMKKMADEGLVPPAELQLRAQERIEQALRIAAGLDDPDLVAALQQIRDQLRIQDQLMLQDGSCTGCEPVMDQTRTMLRDQLQQVEDDLSNPRAFRERYMNQEQNRTNAGDCDPATPCDPPQYGNGEQNQNENQMQEQEQEQNQNGTSEPQGNGGTVEPGGTGGTVEPGGTGGGTAEPGGTGGGSGGTGGTGGNGG
jgi:hypothetical protein